VSHVSADHSITDDYFNASVVHAVLAATTTLWNIIIYHHIHLSYIITASANNMADLIDVPQHQHQPTSDKPNEPRLAWLHPHTMITAWVMKSLCIFLEKNWGDSLRQRMQPLLNITETKFRDPRLRMSPVWLFLLLTWITGVSAATVTYD
jgi:hypothetical protein